MYCTYRATELHKQDTYIPTPYETGEDLNIDSCSYLPGGGGGGGAGREFRGSDVYKNIYL